MPPEPLPGASRKPRRGLAIAGLAGFMVVVLVVASGLWTRNVSQAVADFGARKVGDMVSVGFEDTLTFVLSGPNVATPRNRDTSVTATASATGMGAAGVSASESIGNWWVVGVNPAANTISLVNPAGGEVRTYNVTTQAGREQLPRVKVGDSLTAINTQVLVVAITPKA